jgi:hypothetical protein
MTRAFLLTCGILAMAWYAVMNIIVPPRFPGYDIASYTISELSAVDAPSRPLWVSLAILYSILFLAFGVGVRISGQGNRKLTIVGVVIILDVIFGIFWPPMHPREVIAAGGGTLTDTLHLVWAFVHLALMLVMIGFGAAAFGNRFRIFSVFIVLVFLVFGMLTSIGSQGISTGEPTPMVGIWERINIGAYSVWVIVFAMLMIKRNEALSRTAPLMR